MKFRVLIERDGDGVFVATCPTLPGCVSQGSTRREAVANITDAIQGYLQSLEKHGEAVPLPITEEVVEVNPRASFPSAPAAEHFGFPTGYLGFTLAACKLLLP